MKEKVNELIDLLRYRDTSDSKIQGSVIISIQGLPLFSTLSKKVNHELISAIGASLMSISNYAVKELSRGKLKRILLEGVNGQIILSKVGKNTVLCTLLNKDISLEEAFRHFNNELPKINNFAYTE